MDTYAQRQGSFSEAQEQQLEELKQRSRDLLTVRGPTDGPLTSGHDWHVVPKLAAE